MEQSEVASTGGGVALAERSPRRQDPVQPSPAGTMRPPRNAWIRRLLAAALLTVMAGTFGMSVVLFFANGGASQFDDVGDILVSVGVLSALTATNALLMMMLLAARVPLIDRVLGQAKATSLHAKLGEWVVLGLVVHALFVLVGYSFLDHSSIVTESRYLWGDSTNFILAVFAMLALLTLAVTSFACARRRLPYEAWRAVHLLSYAAIGLAIPHMFSMSGLLAHGSWRRAYWELLLVITGSALLWFRVLTPVLRSLRHRVRVERIVRLDADTFHIELAGRHLDRLHARPGQFLRWRFFTRSSFWEDHPFSLSAVPTATTMRVTVRAAGRGTAALAGLTPGTRVAIEGPYGSFTHDQRTRPSLVLIGAGAGIAPIRALLEHTDVTAGAVTVVLRDSDAARIPLLAEVDALCAARGARLVVLSGHRAAGGRWVPETDPTLTLAEIAPGIADADLFICGPRGFVDDVVADARAAQVPARHIHFEQFTW